MHLQAKYAKLRKIKKKLEALKNPPKPEEKPQLVSSSKAQSAAAAAAALQRAPSLPNASSSSSAAPLVAKDAKEVAKKLIRSGTLSQIQKNIQEKGDKSGDKSSGFKKRTTGELITGCNVMASLSQDSSLWSSIWSLLGLPGLTI